PVTFATVSPLRSAKLREELKGSTRAWTKLPDSVMLTNTARIAVTEAVRDLAMRSMTAYRMRPCLLCGFRRSLDEHGRYERGARTVSGRGRISAPFPSSPESVRPRTESRVEMRPINICYESVARPTRVRFLQV